MKSTDTPVFIAGATGYVGGRLTPQLIEAGYKVRLLVRNPEKIVSRSWGRHPALEIFKGDVFDSRSLEQALTGCKTAFYLVHSMTSAKTGYAQADKTAATNMASAATACGLQRIIYLGGLGGEGDDLSEHLRSRMETAQQLASGTAKLTWLKAAMIIGSGSASFEIMRYLVDRLPIMITPRWVRTEVQPIAIRDVLTYLVGCLENPETAGHEFDIGGPDILNYETLFRIYAEEAKLPTRLIIPVPVLTPVLSSYWIHLVTPVPASLAFPLARGLKNRVVVQDGNKINKFVALTPIGCREAIRYALNRIEQAKVETSWSDAGQFEIPEWASPNDASYAGGTVLKSEYSIIIDCKPQAVWNIVKRVGGKDGWFYGTLLWKIRGLIDRLSGGVGLSRGKRQHTEIHIGDAVDFWRVIDIQENRRLLLLAEMKVPGEAIFEFRLEENGNDKTKLVQTARFLPRGLWGIIYWYAMYPFHHFIFIGMLKRIDALSKIP